MPLRRTQNGWMWGSKGPFLTKAQALAVARAAYAHGFKDANSPVQSEVQSSWMQEPKKQAQ